MGRLAHRRSHWTDPEASRDRCVPSGIGPTMWAPVRCWTKDCRWPVVPMSPRRRHGRGQSPARWRATTVRPKDCHQHQARRKLTREPAGSRSNSRALPPGLCPLRMPNLGHRSRPEGSPCRFATPSVTSTVETDVQRYALGTVRPGLALSAHVVGVATIQVDERCCPALTFRLKPAAAEAVEHSGGLHVLGASVTCVSSDAAGPAQPSVTEPSGSMERGRSCTRDRLNSSSFSKMGIDRTKDRHDSASW